MRKAFIDALTRLAADDERVILLTGDLGYMVMEPFRARFPDRFINVGVAEQSMIGICAGLALKGCQPFAYTIATFSLYRPFEMVRDDLGYQNLPVTVVGMGGGMIYSTLGGTHHTQEDIAIAGAIPNMQVVVPCDPQECTDITHWCATQKNGPVYLRIGKAGEPTLTQGADPWRFGKLRYLQRGSDLCILTYGVITKMAAEVAEAARAKGRSVSLVSCHTLKPIDREGIAEALQSHKEVLVIEEHAPQGGLAPQTKQIAWDIQAKCKITTYTLQDAFIHCYGSHDQLLAAHGISRERILSDLGLK